MAFRELMEGLAKQLPRGASERFAKLTALERMLSGEVYDHLPYSFETERVPGQRYVPLRQRRPSVDFNLAWEITQDTEAELFGDEQFPVVQVRVKKEQDEDATKALADLIGADGLNLPEVCAQAYEEGVCGAVGIVVHRGDDDLPFYEILPAKWCEPVYRSKTSTQLIALVVTYPISADVAEDLFPGILEERGNSSAKTFWYRYVVGPSVTVDYRPLADHKFEHLGEQDPDEPTKTIEFVEHLRTPHGFDGRTPALYVKHPGGKQRDIDGPALWWPVVNFTVEIDYTLSQAGRGLRYSADPMLFLKKSGMADVLDGDIQTDYDVQGIARSAQVQKGDEGDPVRGVTQTIVGEDAKYLEIAADGIKVELEYVRDVREYALEVLGGQKARADHTKNAASGTALNKGLKPLRRLVRRLRVPYGRGLILGLIDLTLYGFRHGIFDGTAIDFDVAAIPERARASLEWPTDETLTGQDLFYQIQADQLAAGGSAMEPIQLLKPEVIAAKLAGDLGMHQPFDAIKGDFQTEDVRNPPPEPKAAPPKA